MDSTKSSTPVAGKQLNRGARRLKKDGKAPSKSILEQVKELEAAEHVGHLKLDLSSENAALVIRQELPLAESAQPEAASLAPAVLEEQPTPASFWEHLCSITRWPKPRQYRFRL